MQITRVLAGVTLAAVTATCSNDLVGGGQNRDLPSDRPETVGLSRSALERLSGRLQSGAYPAVHAIVVVRHGRIAFEKYRDGWTADRLHTIQSISKGIVSLAVGIALDRGEIESLDRTIVSYFSDLPIANLDDRKRAISIADVLRMSTGTDYAEGASDSPPLNSTG